MADGLRCERTQGGLFPGDCVGEGAWEESQPGRLVPCSWRHHHRRLVTMSSSMIGWPSSPFPPPPPLPPLTEDRPEITELPPAAAKPVALDTPGPPKTSRIPGRGWEPRLRVVSERLIGRYSVNIQRGTLARTLQNPYPFIQGSDMASEVVLVGPPLTSPGKQGEGRWPARVSFTPRDRVLAMALGPDFRSKVSHESAFQKFVVVRAWGSVRSVAVLAGDSGPGG